MTTAKSCTVDPTVHTPPAAGHNRPPKDALFGLQSAWLRYAEKIELARLAVLHVRIERKERALADLRKERTTIMNRCIRRMRRAAGKDGPLK